MFTRSKLLLALCVCACALALGAAAAVATVKEYISSPHSFSATSREPVTFSAGEIVVRCNVSMSGSFRSAIGTRSGEAAGSVTRASASGCTGGENVTFLSLPWSMTYSSFTGTQPERMTGFLTLVNGASVSVRSLISCLYRGELGVRFALSGTDPYEVGTISTLTNSLPLSSGFGCPTSGTMTGSFTHAGELFLGEILLLAFEAVPDTLSAADVRALGSMNVTFTNKSGAGITVATVRATNTGWGSTTNWNACTGLIANNVSCIINVIAEMSARPGRIELRTAAPASTLVGEVVLTG
jgi:hypothetical protein